MLGACQIKVFLQQLAVSLSSLFPHVGMDNSIILKLVLPLLSFVFTCQTVPFSISLNPPPFVILFLSMSRVRRVFSISLNPPPFVILFLSLSRVRRVFSVSFKPPV